MGHLLEGKCCLPSASRAPTYPLTLPMQPFPRGRSGAPALLIEWVVIIRPMRVAALLGFVVGCLLSSRAGVGPIFVLAAIAATIFSNLGRRRDGEQSAYSIFNTGMRRLPGQLDADQIDEQMRRGQF
eukprot:366344-Chlamydomonas_euryale.AAC.12